MNTQLLITSYLEGKLSHREEEQLRTILEEKSVLSLEEQTVLAMLTPAPPMQPDEAWWSEEGCTAYDTYVAHSSPTTEVEPSAPKPARLRRPRPLWWGVAAACVGMLIAQWWARVEKGVHETEMPPMAQLSSSAPVASPAPPLVAATMANQPVPLPQRNRSVVPSSTAPDSATTLWASAEPMLTDSLSNIAALADSSPQLFQQCWDAWVEPAMAAMQVNLDYQMFLFSHPDTISKPLYVDL